MRWTAVWAVVLTAACVAGVQAPAAAATVVTREGRAEGRAEGGVTAFKGLPYAAPPVGALRWKAPQAPAAWQGVRQADRIGNACIQQPGLSEANGGPPGPLSEDCLYLNVWTPRAEPQARLPVLVWIHGGAYVFGSGAVPVYSGAPLASRGAVVVTINYRLGLLGFFNHPALEREAKNGPMNFGLLDQIAALRWVKANIAAFGGDPGNVTIAGQSAGAKSVLALMASPQARGLFQKAIAQSVYAVPDHSRKKAREIGVKAANALGLAGERASMAALRTLPAERFGTLKGQGLSNSPVPIHGDGVLPQSIESTFAAGREAAVPLIIGNTSDDASVVAAFGIDMAATFKRLGAAGFLVKALYPGVKDDADVARQAVRDLVFTMPVRWIADRHERRAPTWRYYFDYTAERKRADRPAGVPHGDEIAYALDTVALLAPLNDIATPADRAMAKRVSTYWLSFARDGRPSADAAPVWPNDRGRQDKTMIFGEKTEVEDRFMKRRLDLYIGLTRIVDGLLGRQ